jgi:hypothetical protein
VLLNRTASSATNVAIVGAVCATVALLSLYRLPFLRFINIPLSIWLFISAWMRIRSPTTIVNDLLMATLMFGFACVPIDLDPDEMRGYPAHS